MHPVRVEPTQDTVMCAIEPRTDLTLNAACVCALRGFCVSRYTPYRHATRQSTVCTFLKVMNRIATRKSRRCNPSSWPEECGVFTGEKEDPALPPNPITTSIAGLLSADYTRSAGTVITSSAKQPCGGRTRFKVQRRQATDIHTPRRSL